MGGFIETGIVSGAGLAAGRGLRTGSLFGPWRPPQWSKPSMVMISIPPLGNSNANEDVTNKDTGDYALKVEARGTRSFVFDAVFSIEHDQRLTKTMHPVQTGAALSSHAYLQPARVTMLVGMSDAMQSYASGLDSSKPPHIVKFTGDPSKSVSAYKQMIELQAGRSPLIVVTRLRTYYNMLITSVAPHEDSRTISGLRMRIEFEQIFTASVHKASDSGRVNATDSTGLGIVNAQTPDATTVGQFGLSHMGSQVPLGNDVTDNSIAGWYQTHPDGIDLPGAGDYCSVNTNNLIQLPSPS